MVRPPTPTAYLHELKRIDDGLAGSLAELDALGGQVDALARRAEEIEVFLARLPDERERRHEAVETAELEQTAAAEQLARAELALAAATTKRDGEKLSAARRDEVHARDLHAVACRRLEEALAERTALDREAQALETEVPELEASAARLADALRGRERVAEEAGLEPAPGLAGIREWGQAARAALFVARGSIAPEREALVRQANELVSAMLGESVVAPSVEAALGRLARERGEG